MTRPLIVVCSTHAYWPSHLERDLELIQRHADDGASVLHFVCNGEFEACDGIMTLGPSPPVGARSVFCMNCRDRVKRGRECLVGATQIAKYRELPGWTESRTVVLPRFKDIGELKEFKWGEFDAGMAVASSLISATAMVQPDVSEMRAEIEAALKSAISLYEGFRAQLRAQRPKLVYVFNGRLWQPRALLRACQVETVRCVVHEMGASPDRFSTYEGVLPHDRAYTTARIREAWQQSGRGESAREIAARWFAGRKAGVDQGWFSFVKGQNATLPGTGDQGSGDSIVAFTSSEDEFAAIGPEWKNELFADQVTGLAMLKQLLQQRRPAARLIIRVHPRLASGRDRRELERFLGLEGEGTVVVAPESKVSSYQLMEAASTVVTFGSTMGIEATYWGKASILLGHCFFESLGGTYNPESLDDLSGLLEKKLAPLDKEAALMYGYYMATFGERYKFYEPDGLLRGKFRGVDLDTTSPWIHALGVLVSRWDELMPLNRRRTKPADGTLE